MKRFIIPLFAAILALAVGCTDDLEKRLDIVEDKVETLENKLFQLESNIKAFQAVVEAIQANKYVVKVADINENGVRIGYKLLFSDSSVVEIYNGQQGATGAQGDKGDKGDEPVIGARNDDDGVFCWTVDGQFMTDAEGNHVPVSGPAPLIKVDGTDLLASSDGGKTWTKIGKAADEFFSNVEVTEDAVILTLKGGESVSIPLVPTFYLSCKTEVLVVEGKTLTIAYTVNGAAETDNVVVFVDYFTAGLTAEVADRHALQGTISITPAANVNEGLVSVRAVNNTTGAVSAQAIEVSEGIVNVVDDAISVPARGGEVKIPVMTNEASVSAATEASWLTAAPETKAELREEVITMVAEPNMTDARRTATVTVTGAETGAAREVTVIQDLPSTLDLAVMKGQAILGAVPGRLDQWEILTNKDYSITLDRPAFTMSAGPYNLVDGDLTSTKGTWFSRFDVMNDDPIEFVIDLKTSIAPGTFYVQHFTDTPGHKKFKFYMAKEYKGEDTEWTLVCTADGTQQYMTEPEFDFQSEKVNNASGPQNEAYTYTYALDCQNSIYGRYLKAELYLPDIAAFENGKGKMNEIYMKGIYEDPGYVRPEPIMGNGNWELIEGQELSIGVNDPANAWGVNAYPVTNLIDGNLGFKDGVYWQTGCWISPWGLDIEFPMTFVIDMKAIYRPKVMHTHDAQGWQGQYRNFNFYIADTYNGADTDWKLLCEGRREGYTYISNEGTGADYSYPVTNESYPTGRYLKFEIVDAAFYEGDFSKGRGYLAEVYFEGDYVGSADIPETFKGNGEWTVLEGKEHHYSYDPNRPAGETWSNEPWASVNNLFDGSTDNPFCSWFFSTNTFPKAFVVDLHKIYQPTTFYVAPPTVSGFSAANNWTDWEFYIAESYEGESTVWTKMAADHPVPSDYNELINKVFSYPATIEASGRYLKAVIKSANWMDASTWYGMDGGRCTVGEIYFDGFLVGEAPEEEGSIQVNGSGSYKTISEAVAATAGIDDAVITLPDGTYNELVAVGEGAGKVTIQPASGATSVVIDGGIQTRDRELVVKNITINANVELTQSIRPLLKEGDLYGTSAFPFPAALIVEQNTTKAVLLEGVTISTNDSFKGASGTLLYFTPTTADAAGVTIKNCIINADGTRVCQSYGGKSVFDGNTINGAYKSYAIRFGGDSAEKKGNSITVTNNTFNTAAPALDVHSSALSGTITWGDGTRETNTLGTGMEVVINGDLSNKVCHPANLTSGAAYAIPE